MKKQFYKIIAQCTLALIIYAHTNQQHALEIGAPPTPVHICQERRGFKQILEGRKTTLFSGADVNNSSTTMLTIAKPGLYILNDNMTLNPTNNNSTGILINSDSVILDLNSFQITQDPASIANTLTAIRIASGKQNITIRNGSIRTINGTGVAMSSSGYIEMFNLGITGCTLYGLDLRSINTLSINNITCSYCDGSHASATTGACALYMFECSNFFIENSEFSYNKSYNYVKNATGIFMEGCSWGTVQNCSASQNSGQNAYGFRLKDSTQTTPVAYTISAKGISFDCCIAQGNEAVYLSPNQHLAGDAFGFYLKGGYGNVFYRCDSLLNATLSTHNKSVYGFYVDGGRDNEFVECRAQKQDATLTGTYSSLGSSKGGQAYGFFTKDGKGNKYRSCLSEANCSSTGLGGQTTTNAIAAGFAFVNTEQASVIEASTAIRNNGGKGSGYGIMIGHPDNVTYPNTPTQCVIRSNSLLVNQGVTKQYGIKDFAVPTTSMFLQNLSFGHGKVNPPGGATMSDTGKMNFYVSFSGLSGRAMDKLISEQNSSAMGTLTAADTPMNYSVFDSSSGSGQEGGGAGANSARQRSLKRPGSNHA